MICPILAEESERKVPPTMIAKIALSLFLTPEVIDSKTGHPVKEGTQREAGTHEHDQP